MLVPARLLPLKPVWLDIVHALGEQDLLLILPASRDAKVLHAFEQVGRSFRRVGYYVKTISADQVRGYGQTVLDGS